MPEAKHFINVFSASFDLRRTVCISPKITCLKFPVHHSQLDIIIQSIPTLPGFFVYGTAETEYFYIHFALENIIPMLTRCLSNAYAVDAFNNNIYCRSKDH